MKSPLVPTDQFDSRSTSVSIPLRDVDVSKKRRPFKEAQFGNWELPSKNGELIKRLAEFSSLSRIAEAVTSSLDLREFLHSVLLEIRNVLDFKVAAVWLLDEHGEELFIAASEGLAPEHQTRRIPRGFGLIGWTTETGQPYYVPNYSREPRRLVMRDVTVRSGIYGPLRMGNEKLGVMLLCSPELNAYSSAELSFLSTIANQVAAAIASTRVYKQIEQLAILEERNRIARELHDCVAQTLGYLAIDTELIDSYLSDGDTTRARRELSRMRKALKETYSEVREFMDGLRTKVSDHGGLVPALTRCVQEFREQTGTKAELTTLGDLTELSPLVELHVLRILQEGLANVKKHSQASWVTVRIELQATQLEIIIEDDGKGFNAFELHEGNRRHLGITIMRERVERLSGHFEVRSQFEQGTKIIAKIPEPQRWR